MKKRALVIGVVVAALLVAGGALRVYMVQQRARAQILSGAIEARDVEVGSMVGGRVLRVEVEEGQRVTAGQTLVVLEPDLVDPQIQEQQGTVEAARAALERA